MNYKRKNKVYSQYDQLIYIMQLKFHLQSQFSLNTHQKVYQSWLLEHQAKSWCLVVIVKVYTVRIKVKCLKLEFPIELLGYSVMYHDILSFCG